MHPLSPSFGKQLLEIVTAGMYSDPLMILREYVQNSADSIDTAVGSNLLKSEDSKIEIQLEGQSRTLTVLDNGVGVGNLELEEKLGSLGQSSKMEKGQRGFRGIGRLGGLTYCDKLVFETRSLQDTKIGSVEWNGKMLRDSVATRGLKGLEEVISAIAQISFRTATSKDPQHFFKVSLQNVNKFHTDRLTSLDSISEYLARIAPLPYDQRHFSFAKKIEDYLNGFSGYKTHRIFLNGIQVFSPYRDDFLVTKKKSDAIKDISLVDFRTADGRVFGKGWIARTSLLGTIPKEIPMRCISVRQGNIEIGNENFLDEFFQERRFAGWHIGAFHLDYSVRPNARRDGFEETDNYERFLEQVIILCRQMGKACRSASVKRYDREGLERSIRLLEKFSRGGLYVDRQHFDQTSRKMRQLFSQLLEVHSNNESEQLAQRFRNLKHNLSKTDRKTKFISDVIDSRLLKNVRHTQLLEMTCRSVLRNIKQDALSSKVLLDILSPFVKARRKARGFSQLVSM